MTYMFILKCALKLVLKNILYYDARSEKHQITGHIFCIREILENEWEYNEVFSHLAAITYPRVNPGFTVPHQSQCVSQLSLGVY